MKFPAKLSPRAALLVAALTIGGSAFGAPAASAGGDLGKIDPHMAVKATVSDGIRWYDPAKPPFRIAGLYWFRENNLYRRLPVRGDLPPAVAKLARHTTGATIAFRTDSRRIQIDVKLTDYLSDWHMSSCGRSGFDLYAGGPGKWHAVGISKYPTDFKSGRVEISSPYAPRYKPEMKEYLIDFPSYNGFEFLRIGIEAGSKLLPPTPFSSPKRIVAYGGSTMQGACASRPGRAFMNIIGRHFNLEVFNFGFSGSSHFEPVMAELVAAVENPAVIIIEGDRNAGWRRIRDDEPKFIEIIRKKHPGVPIVVMNGNPWWDPDPSRKGNVAQQVAFMKRMQPKDPDLIFWDCVDFIGPDHSEGLVDGKHPNDLGFQRMADHMIRLLTPILQKYKVIE